MTEKELLSFKKILGTEQDAAVRAALRRRQSIAIEQSAEEIEQISYDTERELAVADISRHSDLVRQIRAALGRIENGTFGVCQCCRKPIRLKRIKAVPWTSLCIRCQETVDGQDRLGLYAGEGTRATAA